MEPTAADERPHPPGPEPAWSECWSFDFVADDGSLGGWARLTLLPNLNHAWYHGFLAGPDRQLVAVLDTAVPLPSTGLEIRTTGLWADHICETPFDHWTIGLEAFGLGVDDPAEIYGRQLGDRVPLGFDLEWEAERDWAPIGPDAAGSGYQQECQVTGEILVGRDAIEFDGYGYRDHRWGVARHADEAWLAVRGRLDDGTSIVAEVVGGDLGPAAATIDGAAVEVIEMSESLGAHGFPTGARLVLDQLEIALDPIGLTPVEVVDSNGRRARMPRAICRLIDERGRTGYGWAEWNQPQN